MSPTPFDEQDEAIEIFRVLGHPLRMAILSALGSGERAVGDIGAATGVVMSTLSQQLAILRKAELVHARREAKQVFYSLNPETFLRARAALGALASSCAHEQQLVPLATPGIGRVGAAMFARVQPRN